MTERLSPSSEHLTEEDFARMALEKEVEVFFDQDAPEVEVEVEVEVEDSERLPPCGICGTELGSAWPGAKEKQCPNCGALNYRTGIGDVSRIGRPALRKKP